MGHQSLLAVADKARGVEKLSKASTPWSNEELEAYQNSVYEILDKDLIFDYGLEILLWLYRHNIFSFPTTSSQHLA